MPRKSKNKAPAPEAREGGNVSKASIAADVEQPSWFQAAGGDAFGKLKVNKKFAEKYEHRKREQDLARAEELGLLNGEPQTDSEDGISEDEGEQLTAQVDRKILATIAAIRRKDPRVYKPDTTFFKPAPVSDDEEGSSDSDSDAGSEAPKSKKKAKKVTAKDVMRQQLLDAAARGETDAFGQDEEDGVGGPKPRLEDGDRNPKVYDAEQEELRRAFLATAAAEEGDGDDAGGMLVVKEDGNKKKKGKGKKDKAADKDEEDDLGLGLGDDDEGSVGSVDRDTLRAFLKAKAPVPLTQAQGGKRNRGVHTSAPPPARGGVAEHAEEIADPDAFLDAYMRSRAWQEEDDDDDGSDGDAGGPLRDDAGNGDDEPGSAGSDSDAAGGVLRLKAQPKAAASSKPGKRVGFAGEDLDADEAELDKADAFEAAWNFRFEEPGGGEIVTHSRTVEGSLRRKEPKRKEARDRRKERKEEERRSAEAETRRLMNLKRGQLKGRMSKIREVAGDGLDFDTLARVLGDDLDADFDPAEHDKRMAALFGDEYYGQGEDPEGAAAAAAGEAKAGKGKSAAAAAGGEEGAEGEGDDDEDEEGVAPWVFGDGPRPAWAGPSAEELAMGADDGFDGNAAGRNGDDEEEEEEGGEEDEAVSGRRKGGKRARKAARNQSEVARVKALLARSDAATAGDSADNAPRDDSDEILALGFEDVIAGGLRTRFGYTTVPVGDYGLSAEEILLAEDKDLNSFLGLRRLAPYRDSEWAMPSKVRKRAVSELRKRLKEDLLQRAPELVAREAEEEEGGAKAEAPPAPAGDEPAADEASAADEKKRKRKRKHAKGGAGDGQGEGEDAGPVYVTNSFEAPAAASSSSASSAAAAGETGAAASSGDASEGKSSSKKDKKEKKEKREKKERRDGGDRRGKKDGKRGRGTGEGDADAVVTLPSGAQMKKARLASYGL